MSDPRGLGTVTDETRLAAEILSDVLGVEYLTALAIVEARDYAREGK